MFPLFADLLFALWYNHSPEGRELRDQIYRAWAIRGLAAGTGLVLAYLSLRIRFSSNFIGGVEARRVSMPLIGAGLCLGLGVLAAWFLWTFAEVWAGGYFFLDAWKARAEKEIILGVLGLAGWSFVLGSLFQSCFFWISKNLQRKTGMDQLPRA